LHIAYHHNRAVYGVGFLSKHSLGTRPSSGLSLAISRPSISASQSRSQVSQRGPTISEDDSQLEHEHDSPHITARVWWLVVYCTRVDNRKSKL